MKFVDNIFKNDEDRRAARVITWILFTSLAAYLFTAAMGFYWHAPSVIYIAVIGVLLLLLPLGLLMRGHLRGSGMFAVLSTLATITVFITFGQGIHDIAIPAYPVIFIFAALLLPRRDFIITAALSMGLLAWLAIDEAFEIFTVPASYPGMGDFIVVAVIMLVGIVSVDLLAENMRENLRRARQQSSAREQSDAKYRDLMENMQDIVFSVDAHGILTFISPQLRTLGYEPADFALNHISKLMTTLVDPIDIQQAKAASLHPIPTEGENPITISFRIRAASGQRKWLEVTNKLQCSSDGSFAGVLGIMRDVTAGANAKHAAKIISEVQFALLQPCEIIDIYTLVSKKVQELIGNCVTGVSMLNESTQIIRGMAYHGLNVPFEKITAVFGKNLFDASYPIASMTDNELHIYRSGRLERLDDGLHTILASLAPRPLCVAVEKLLQVQDVYAVGFVHEDEHLGALIILSRIDISPYQNTVEQIVNLASFAIERRRAETALQNSERRLQALIANGLDYISLLDIQGKLIWESPSSTNMLGYGFNEFQGKSLFEIMHPDDMVWTAGQLAEVAREPGSRRSGVFRLRHADGSWRWVDAIASNFINDPAVGAIVLNYRDTTERKRSEEAIQRRNNELSALNQVGQALSKLATLPEIIERLAAEIGQILDNRNLYIALYDASANYITFPVYTMDGYRRNSTGRPLGNGITDYVIRNNQPVLIKQNIEDALRQLGIEMIGTRSSSFVAVPMRADNKVIGVIAHQDYEKENAYDEHHVEFLMTIAAQAAIALENARLYSAIQQELKERKQAEEALHLSEMRYRQAITAAGAVPYFRDYQQKTETYTFIGEDIQQLTGYSSDEITPAIFDGMELESTMRGSLAHLTQAEAIKLSSEGKTQHWTADYRIRARDGQIRWLADSAIPIRDENNRRLGVIGILQDITERKLAEGKILAALEEKETLLREVHHRVKNNLQVIIALIKMRIGLSGDADTRQFLKELEDQARTMSLVYEQLYQSDNLARVDMGTYLHQLTSNVLEGFDRRSVIQVDLNAPLFLDVAYAMPCGLIVNELFTNVLKHAFPPGYRGKPRVVISMQQEGENCRLFFSDNGIGMPGNYDWKSNKSLGIRLVNLWAMHQLGGTLDVSTESGTTFAISFNLK